MTHSLYLSTFLVAVCYCSCVASVTVQIRCDYTADGCEGGSYTSVETFIATYPPVSPDVDLRLFGASEYNLTMEGYEMLFGYVRQLKSVSFLGNEKIDRMPNMNNFTMESLEMQSVNSIVNLHGLENTTITKTLFLTDNDALRTLEGLGDVMQVSTLRVYSNSALVSLDGFAANPTWHAYTLIYILSNPVLNDTSALNPINGTCEKLYVYTNDALAVVNFTANLYANYVWFTDTVALEYLSMLNMEPTTDQAALVIENAESLEFFGGVDFRGTGPELVSFSNMPNRNGDFTLANLDYHTNVDATIMSVYSFTNVGGDIRFTNAVFHDAPTGLVFKSTGVRNFDGVNATGVSRDMIGGLTLEDNSELVNFDGLSGLLNQNSDFVAYYYSISYLFSGAYGLDVGDMLGVSIVNNSNLETLDGLKGTTTLFGTLTIHNNPSLTSTAGLADLVGVYQQDASYTSYFSELPNHYPGSLQVTDNDALTDHAAGLPLHAPRLAPTNQQPVSHSRNPPSTHVCVWESDCEWHTLHRV